MGGLGTRGRRWAGAMLAVVALAAPAAARATCQMATNAELDVRFSANKPLVRAEINGTPVWLLVDTGAYASSLFVGAAERLGLKPYDTGAEAVGIGGRVKVMRADLDVLKLQKAEVKHFGMNIAGGANMDAANGAVGLLGRDFLGLADVEFDLANGKIRLFTPKDCGRQSLAYWTKEPAFVDMHRGGSRGAPFLFPLKLNGYYVEATLDSGAGLTVVSPSVAAHAGVRPDQFSAGVGHSRGIGAHLMESRTATFDSVDLGDEKIPNAQLQVTQLSLEPDEAGAGSRIGAVGGGGAQMLLGADFLRAHRVLISGSQDRIYFTYNGGPVFHKVTTDRPSSQPAPTPPANPGPAPAQP